MQNIFKISNGDLKKRVLTVLMGISLLLQGGGSPLIAYAFVNPFAIINATKIICDSETMLPNWGLGGPDISANTATDYIASHSGCHLASGWEFQWGYAGVRDLSGDFVGIADGSKGPGTQTGTGGDEWKTFGPSSPNGVAVADVLLKSETDIILVREVAQDGYIPFKYDPAHQSNANAVSAEMYCNNDVLNYDNYDKIISPQVRNTYYCIAFNALKTDIPPNNQKPVISVVGTNPAEVILGSTYVDQGATVFDSEDGQINSKLVTSGSVDVNTLGVYTITYNATDTANLSADTKTRTVTVVSTPVCLAPVDLMLVIDRSGSMKFDGTNPEQPLKQAKDGAVTFIDGLSVLSDKVGVVTYSSSATLNSALSSNFSAVKSSFASITAYDGTNIGAAIMKATNEMTTNGRIGTKHVMVLLSDGVPEVLGMTTAEASADAVAKATTAKSLGTVVYTIGLGANVNPTLMKQIASLPANYYFAPTGAALASIYQTIAATECRRDPATVSGTKINDVNANGTINQGEIGIEGWEITLTEVAGNGLVLRTNTGIGGDFEFSDVIPGNYLLCEVARTGWVQTAPSVAVYSGCYFLNLDPGAVLAEQNFLNTESNKPQCRDGKDNDNDGKIDFVGGDAGCNDPEDNDENQKPIISVIGTNPAIVTLGDTYSDQSATVADPEEGDITAKLVTTGTVDTSVMGNYTITYNATDSQNVSAVTKTRTVRVVVACADGRDNDSDGKIDFAGGDTGCDNPGDNDENNRPVITILGANPFNVTQDGTFTDPGATAFDPEELDVTSAIVIAGSIDTSLVGSYTLRYNVSDSKGLAAVEKTRIVNVTPPVTECNDGLDNDGDSHVDYSEDLGCDNSEDNDENEKPVITVLGDDPFVVYLGTTFVDPSATVVDPEEGDITTPNLVTTGIVDSNILGIYTVTYNAADSKGLAADTKSRTVKVVTSCSDGKDNDGDTLIDFPADLGCDSVTDDSENAKPVISLLGDVVMNLIVGTPYVEAGATVHDEEDGQISNKLVIFGTVDSHTSGAYVITYNATDSVNVAADEVSRTINVSSGQCTENCGGSTPPACSDGSDNDGDGLADFPRDPGCDSPQDNDERDTGPVITLLGANPMSIAVGTVFVDPGATAYDPQDGDITSLIVVTGSVNSSSAGAYTLTYNVSDAQGHAATPVDRTVNVISGGGGCTSNCGGTESLIITNEKLTSTGTTTVLITWNTNLPSDSRVAYGLDPVVTLGVQPLYGYDLTTATDATATTSHSVTVEGIPSSASAYFRPVSTAGTQSAVGMELTRGGVLGESTECFYLNEYMRLGANNTPSEVTKLQSFLRNFEGFTTLEVNGFFDITTDVAVRQFQDKYKTDVLIPWNLPANTGYVYYTTQKKINEIYCQREFPMNAMQITEIMAYRQLVNESRIHGDVMPVSSVNTNTETSGDVAGANSEKLDGIAEANTSGLLADVVLTETPADAPVKVNRGRIALADLLATAPRLSNELSGTDEDQDLSEEDAEFGVVAGVSTKSGLAATIESLTDRLHLSSASLILLGLLLILAVTLGIYFIKNYNRSNETQ